MAASTMVAAGSARAQTTDSDYGAGADPVGRGRGNSGRTGITDRDPSDPAGNGRGTGGAQSPSYNPQASTGSSAGAGAQSDPYNSGATGTGPAGANSDPRAGSGAPRACTDSDLSPADPVGRGRRC